MLSDSRRFSRTLAAVGLVAGPLLFAIEAAVDPAWDDDTGKYLDEVADAPGRYELAGVLGLLGALFLIAGLVGVAHLLRGRRVSLGQVGAGLMAIGAVILSGTVFINVMEAEASDSDKYPREVMVSLFDELEESTVAAVVFLGGFLLCIGVGAILLAIALWRKRAVPRWAPILLVLALFATFAAEGQVGSIVSSLLLTAALGAIAMKILSLSDDQWEAWTPLESEAGPVEPAPAPERPAPAGRT
jgi:MFS family permease